MHACVPKEGTSTQTFHLLLSDVLSVELLYCYRCCLAAGG